MKDNGKIGKKYTSDQYIPSHNNPLSGGATKTVYRLQDASVLSSSSSSHANLSSISMHQILPASLMAAQAAMFRLSEEEMENERGCGCGRQFEERVSVDDIKANENEVLCVECDENDNGKLKSPPSDEMEMMNDEVDDIAKSREEVANTSATPPDIIDLINVNLVIQEISNSLDESIAMSLNMDSSSSVERLLMIRESVQKILNGLSSVGNYSRRQVYNSFGLLKTFIGNAKDLPDEKYRSIKANSKKFENLIIRIDGAMSLLEATGFEHCDGDKKVQLKRFDPVLLYMAFSFVDLCLNVIDRAMNETIVSGS